MSIARHFDRLLTLRETLEDRLLLQEVRHGSEHDEGDDGTIAELRDRIAELSEQIQALEHRPTYLHV